MSFFKHGLINFTRADVKHRDMLQRHKYQCALPVCADVHKVYTHTAPVLHSTEQSQYSDSIGYGKNSTHPPSLFFFTIRSHCWHTGHDLTTSPRAETSGDRENMRDQKPLCAQLAVRHTLRGDRLWNAKVFGQSFIQFVCLPNVNACCSIKPHFISSWRHSIIYAF